MSRIQKIATAIISLVLAICLASIIAYKSGTTDLSNSKAEGTTEALTEVATEITTDK